jgi:predicted transcriptional regulator
VSIKQLKIPVPILAARFGDVFAHSPYSIFPIEAIGACLDEMRYDGQIYVLLVLYSLVPLGETEVWAAQSTLAKLTRLSVSTLKRELKKLTQAGLIKSIQRGGRGDGDTSVWDLQPGFERLQQSMERVLKPVKEVRLQLVSPPTSENIGEEMKFIEMFPGIDVKTASKNPQEAAPKQTLVTAKSAVGKFTEEQAGAIWDAYPKRDGNVGRADAIVWMMDNLFSVDFDLVLLAAKKRNRDYENEVKQKGEKRRTEVAQWIKKVSNWALDQHWEDYRPIEKVSDSVVELPKFASLDEEVEYLCQYGFLEVTPPWLKSEKARAKWTLETMRAWIDANKTITDRRSF